MPMRTVWCPTCRTLDGRYVAPGATVNDLTCIECGDAVVTIAHRIARVHMYTYIANRCKSAVTLAANGGLDVSQAVEMAQWAAHEAFARRLVQREEAPA